MCLKHSPKITTPEQFAIALCEHFLKTYSQVVRAEIYVEQAPWRRMDQSGEQHAHAFIQTQEATRYCVIRQERDGKGVGIDGRHCTLQLINSKS